MSIRNKNNSKVCCDRYRKYLRAFNDSHLNYYKRVKRVVVSKKSMCNSSKEECCSTGVLNCYNVANISKTPKKTTKSDITFNQNQCQNEILDCCKKCGDTASNTYISSTESNGISKYNHLCTIPALNKTNKSSKPKNNKEKKHLHQYYRNDKFYESSDSFYGTDQIRGPSLNTIIEHPEKSLSTDSVFKICSDKSESEIDFIDPNNIDNIKKLKEFRKKNYFECHSAKSRISTNSSVTSLNNHKCEYRFYLNDRLFPIPVNSDYQDNIRCIECQLPLKINDCQNSINGTIQAKVKLNDKVQDMMLLLPVKNSLIVQERRQSIKKEENNLYFGIIKLNLYGDSIFNRNLPSDSLALRYQKGYEELSGNNKCNYKSLEQDDIIII